MTITSEIVSAPAEPIAGKTRLHLVDIVKGVAIALVVYGHTAQGMTHRGWWTGPGYDFSRAFIYSFHMPAFFFVAGLFLHGSLNRRGWKPFVTEKLKTILYPYALWCFIGFLAIPLTWWVHAQEGAVSYGQLGRDILDGNVSWFLYTLFLCFMLALLTIKMPNWLRFVLAAMVSILTPNIYGQIVLKLPHEFCFLAAGMWVGGSIHRVHELKPAVAAIGFCMLMAVQAMVIHLYGEPGPYLFIPLGLLGTAALFLLARALEHSRTGMLLIWTGQASLGIFLFSAYLQVGVRETLARVLHTHAFWPQIVLPTLAAILIPAIIWHRQKQWKVAWLFRWPNRSAA
ncbi:MAG TPA: acyltransferase [Acidobacteriaceae bacterium]